MDNDNNKRRPVGCAVLGAALDDVRTGRGLTVAQLLDGTGIAPSTWYRWVAGEIMPVPGNMARVFGEDAALSPEEWDRIVAVAPAGLRDAFGSRPVRAVGQEDNAGSGDLAAVGRLFSLARVRRGASVDDMAQAAGMGRSSWRRWASGIALPDPLLARVWARAVKLSPMERVEFGQALAEWLFGSAVVSVDGDCDALSVPRVDAPGVAVVDCDGAPC